jgi:hypothetical protein
MVGISDGGPDLSGLMPGFEFGLVFKYSLVSGGGVVVYGPLKTDVEEGTTSSG